MNNIRISLFILTLLILPACALFDQNGEAEPLSVTNPTPTSNAAVPASQVSDNGIKTEKPPTIVTNLAYVEDLSVDQNLTSLDVYPLSGEDHPVLIYIHGGGWSIGDKKNLNQKPQAFNAAGYVFVSINYRLLPEANVAQQAGDVASAIAWVHDHAGQYGGNQKRIFLMGHSAGAHLVSLVASDPAYLEAVGLSPAMLSGVVALDTQTYDIPRLMQSGLRLGRRIYLNAFGSDPADWMKLSPITYIREGQGIPPFIVAYSGSGDERAEQSEQFVARLQAAGIEAMLLPAPDKTHTEINRQFGQEGDEVTRAVLNFLEKISTNVSD